MNDYNIFKVLKLERKETIHSAMIAAIVGHDEKCWTTFFNMLEEKGKAKGFNIKALRDSIIFDDNINHKWIDTENVLEKLNKKERDDDWGRADIWIGTNKGTNGERYRLIIENKIDADFQYRQLRGYYRYLIEEPRKLAGLFVLCVNDNMAFREKAKVAATRDLNDNVFKPTLSPLSDNDRLFLKAMADCEEPVTIKELQEKLGEKGPAIQPYRKRLIEAGIIESPRRGELVFSIPYFSEYLKSQT